MNLPKVSGVTPFDQLNLVLSRVTFEGDLTADMRQWLTTQVATFNKTVQGDPTARTYFYLQFPDELTMTVCQHNSRELPTRALFDRMIQELGMTLPHQASVATRVVEGEAPTRAHNLTNPHRLFVPRHSGFRR
jgi:hypothetical protein